MLLYFKQKIIEVEFVNSLKPLEDKQKHLWKAEPNRSGNCTLIALNKQMMDNRQIYRQKDIAVLQTCLP